MKWNGYIVMDFLESFADEMRKSMACQAAVKINMPLTREKMEYLG